jgi:hypothetical protein
MKELSIVRTALAALTLCAMPALAQITYPGPGVADGTTADGNAISSVVINNDASTISFTINATQPMASYIFYAIEMQIVGQAGSGDAGLVNPWGPHVGISTGENALVNTYGTGATPFIYSGGSWASGASVSYSAGGTGSTSASMTIPLSSLGLSVGESFYFDVVSSYTGGTPGQSAYGALANTGYLAESDNSYKPYLGSNFYDSATAAGTTFGTSADLYTISAVPEPTATALLGSVGLLALILRRRRV